MIFVDRYIVIYDLPVYYYYTRGIPLVSLGFFHTLHASALNCTQIVYSLTVHRKQKVDSYFAKSLISHTIYSCKV
jgi:hypothetical protein